MMFLGLKNSSLPSAVYSTFLWFMLSSFTFCHKRSTGVTFEGDHNDPYQHLTAIIAMCLVLY